MLPLCDERGCSEQCTDCGLEIDGAQHANVGGKTYHDTYKCLGELSQQEHYVHHTDGSETLVGHESPRKGSTPPEDLSGPVESER
jgi:hypothetical protein